jgi:hypothetical protein
MSGGAFNTPDVSHSEVCTMTKRKSTRSPIQMPLPIEGATIEIELTKGYTAIVDAVDADLSQFNWYALTSDTKVYAYRRDRISLKYIGIHKVILERALGRSLEKGEVPDHWDGNGLNNSRENLRLATDAQNSYNSRMKLGNKSGYKGVAKKRNRWGAWITVDGKSIGLGVYDTPEEAHEAYKRAATKYFGEFARFE